MAINLTQIKWKKKKVGPLPKNRVMSAWNKVISIALLSEIK